MIVDKIFPDANLLTTVLDVDFDLRQKQRVKVAAHRTKRRRRRTKKTILSQRQTKSLVAATDQPETAAKGCELALARPSKPPFLEKSTASDLDEDYDYDDDYDEDCDSYDDEADSFDDEQVVVEDNESESGRKQLNAQANRQQQQVRHRSGGGDGQIEPLVLPKQSETNRNGEQQKWPLRSGGKQQAAATANSSVVEMSLAGEDYGDGAPPDESRQQTRDRRSQFSARSRDENNSRL